MAIFDDIVVKIVMTTTVNEKQSKVEFAEVLSTIETILGKKKYRGVD